MAKRAYVVFRGRKTGVYTDWPSCSAQVNGYSNAVFIGYESIADAEEAWSCYIKDTRVTSRCDEDFAARQWSSTLIWIFMCFIVLFLWCWIVCN
jgi:viroplasmin and RNaseH domain-containing protein